HRSCLASVRLEVLQLDLGGAGWRFGDLADDPWLLASVTQNLQGVVDLVLGHADDHADTAVQHAVHLVLVDVAFFLQPVEHRRALPAGHVDDRLGVVRQYAWDVVQQAATGDVSHGLDRAGFLDQLQQRLDVDTGRSRQQFGQRLAVELDALDIGAGDFDDLADQRVTVGVWARGRQGDQRVTGGDFRAVDDLGLFHHTDAEAGQVVVLALVHARHLGGFTTDQRAAG